MVNLVLFGVVIVVGIMVFEMICEGFVYIIYLISFIGFFINFIVFLFCIVLEFFVLVKVMYEIVYDVGLELKGFCLFKDSILNLGKVKVVIKFVFLEDFVVIGGGFFVMIVVIIFYFIFFY